MSPHVGGGLKVPKIAQTPRGLSASSRKNHKIGVLNDYSKENKLNNLHGTLYKIAETGIWSENNFASWWVLPETNPLG